MLKSTIDFRVMRVNNLLHQIDDMNDQARLLMDLIAKEDKEEKDLIRYGGVLGD